VSFVAIQTDGKILAGGVFNRVNGQIRTNLARLNTDGTLDTNFNARISYPLSSSIPFFNPAMQADGNILFGTGTFSFMFGGTNFIGRLINTSPATQALSLDGSIITWLRGGTGAEFGRTTFEACTNGADWASLGDGSRIAGGWQLSGLSLPPETPIRARGFLTGGANNGSSWYAETTLSLRQAPRIIADDSAFGFKSNHFSFNVTAIPSQTIVIEASSNLANWSAVYTNTFSGNTFYFTDSSAAFRVAQFYRARLQ
jgi:hypothetical protein